MRRTIIFADDGLLNEFKSLSAEENRSVAERLGITTILATDRRHFSLVTPAHSPAFSLLP